MLLVEMMRLEPGVKVDANRSVLEMFDPNQFIRNSSEDMHRLYVSMVITEKNHRNKASYFIRSQMTSLKELHLDHKSGNFFVNMQSTFDVYLGWPHA